ncbi:MULTISPECIES: hypothetical protein [unclassified Nitratiruptor]|uniref:hypothetical protein n=1 Tax=unclassified Nitratiruptor TaxID=2624044 RepID=UPI00191606BB|nr:MULTISPECIES: hypothetical protein [unclassified Nitratiruptor]BCD60070.1 hypothetical protein NitYY0810_C0835 [Nitratiruptor sp. YY08-10]BCD64441.1 hypothetical protein NitYY0814_C1286 [Nitratiruptor sp. YY08-14]
MQPHLPPLNVENVLKEQTFFKLPQVSLNLKVNGTVRAEVVDVLPSGSVLVRINGQELEMRTEIPLQKDTTLLLKVLGMPGSEKAIKLQLLEILSPKKEKVEKKLQSLDLTKDLQLALRIALGNKDDETVQILLQKGLNEQLQRMNEEIIQTLKPESFVALSSSQDFKTLIAQAKELIKKGAKNELEEVLKNVKNLPQLKNADTPLLRYIARANDAQTLVQRFEQINDIFFPAEQFNSMLTQDIQQLILNSGTFLEKRLDTLVKQFTLLQNVQEQLDVKTPKEIKEFVLNATVLDEHIKALFSNETQKPLQILIQQALHTLHTKAQEIITHDLKVLVAQMKESLGDDKKVSTLYHNLQNFQLYSLVSGMVYTYLPVVWQDLKEGSLRVWADKKHYFCQIDLDFEDIGKAQVDLLMIHNSLKVEFFIEDAVFREILRDGVTQLIEDLEDFEDVFVTFVSHSGEKTRYTTTDGINITV